ncbi:MAG: iron-sulfur cluster co-chaperone HscB C-terminal domain-containing protein [Phycisphaerales bacterium JB060]
MATSPFDILGIPAAFDLSQTDIEQAYLARIAAAHPDLAPSDGSADPSALNEARATLIDPERRARALLAIRAPGAKPPPLPPDFLAEILDVRQEAEQAVEAGDTQAVARWRQWASDRRADLAQELGKLFGPGDGPLDDARASAVAGVLQQWRYFERMLEQVGMPAYGPDA